MDIQQPQQAQITLNESERQRCEVWTRVMGYHRPVAAFNPGKYQEHAERLHFEERSVPEYADQKCTDQKSIENKPVETIQ